MIRPTMQACILLLVIVVVASSGCTTGGGTPGAPPATGATSGPVTTPSTTAPVSVVMVPTTAGPSSAPADRSTLNVMRDQPFTINGTVPDPAITKVQVWLLNGVISMTALPVNMDGTFSYTLNLAETAALSRNFTSVVVVQYPSASGIFTVTRDPVTGEIINTGSVTATRLLDKLKDPGTYPTTQVDYLEQGIDAAGNSATVYFLNGVDAGITIDPVTPGQPGFMVVSGTTSLPAGTPLDITFITASMHPTPKNYDDSHEIATGTAVVSAGTGGINTYAGAVNTSRLNTGRYSLIVRSADDRLQAESSVSVDLIAARSPSPQPGNYIDWSQLALPPLAVNTGISPVVLAGGWKIVPPGTQKGNNELPYGSIIDCAPDGICRVFDSQGSEFLAVYNSNEEHQMEVPNGAMVDQGAGNVTFIRLNGSIVLTKIDEFPAR